MTRKITPHKGGRTARLDIRVTPETLAQIELKAEKFHNGNKTELVIAAVSTYEGGRKPPVLKGGARK